ncbi:MAG: hypothetical protein MJY87_06030 [Fibrobacter sp.]|nr:hypothetical protein [Fibrobacter sp.]
MKKASLIVLSLALAAFAAPNKDLDLFKQNKCAYPSMDPEKKGYTLGCPTFFAGKTCTDKNVKAKVKFSTAKGDFGENYVIANWTAKDSEYTLTGQSYYVIEESKITHEKNAFWFKGSVKCAGAGCPLLEQSLSLLINMGSKKYDYKLPAFNYTHGFDAEAAQKYTYEGESLLQAYLISAALTNDTRSFAQAMGAFIISNLEADLCTDMEEREKLNEKIKEAKKCAANEISDVEGKTKGYICKDNNTSYCKKGDIPYIGNGNGNEVTCVPSTTTCRRGYYKKNVEVSGVSTEAMACEAIPQNAVAEGESYKCVEGFIPDSIDTANKQITGCRKQCQDGENFIRNGESFDGECSTTPANTHEVTGADPEKKYYQCNDGYSNDNAKGECRPWPTGAEASSQCWIIEAEKVSKLDEEGWKIMNAGEVITKAPCKDCEPYKLSDEAMQRYVRGKEDSKVRFIKFNEDGSKESKIMNRVKVPTTKDPATEYLGLWSGCYKCPEGTFLNEDNRACE